MSGIQLRLGHCHSRCKLGETTDVDDGHVVDHASSIPQAPVLQRDLGKRDKLGEEIGVRATAAKVTMSAISITARHGFHNLTLSHDELQSNALSPFVGQLTSGCNEAARKTTF